MDKQNRDMQGGTGGGDQVRNWVESDLIRPLELAAKQGAASGPITFTVERAHAPQLLEHLRGGLSESTR